MHCSYKVQISSQKFVGNRVRPIRILQNFYWKSNQPYQLSSHPVSLPLEELPSCFPLSKRSFLISLLRGRQDSGPSQQNEGLPAQIAMNSGITSFQSQGLYCLKWKRSVIFNRSGILSISVYLSI